jgi:hypothetical protein
VNAPGRAIEPGYQVSLIRSSPNKGPRLSQNHTDAGVDQRLLAVVTVVMMVAALVLVSVTKGRLGYPSSEG